MRNLTFRGFLTLIRYKVSLAVAFSACPALFLAREGFLWKDLLAVAGILLMASGASALNQYQERSYDSKMVRTSGRPLPSGQIKSGIAIFIAILLIAAGLIVFTAGRQWSTLLLGVFTLLWYNGFYTILKRITAFAVVPGALTGAIPVMMGWTAAGGHITDPLPLFLAFFIFLWQVPHFWLLALIHEKDYRNAGFPLLSDSISIIGIKRIIFAWLSAASVSTLMLLFFKLVSHSYSVILAILMTLSLMILSIYLLFIIKQVRLRLLFILVNIFMLAVFCILILEHI